MSSVEQLCNLRSRVQSLAELAELAALAFEVEDVEAVLDIAIRTKDARAGVLVAQNEMHGAELGTCATTLQLLADIADAFRYLESQRHFGKICLDI